MKDLFSIIHSRKSVRNFTGESVSRDQLDQIIRAGMAAPTAVNMQPWSFVAVTDRKTMNDLARGLPYAQMLTTAGAAIIVCTEIDLAFNQSRDFAIIDASLAGENILLAIEALGLGGLWTTVYPDPGRMLHVRMVLGIPEKTIPLCAIPIGVPAGMHNPIDKYKQEKIHWERW